MIFYVCLDNIDYVAAEEMFNMNYTHPRACLNVQILVNGIEMGNYLRLFFVVLLNITNHNIERTLIQPFDVYIEDADS